MPMRGKVHFILDRCKKQAGKFGLRIVINRGCVNIRNLLI